MAHSAPRRLRVLDLFAGLGGLSNGFRSRGHEVLTLDYEARFGCDLTMDIREFAKDPQRYLNEAALKRGFIKPGENWLPDIILGGPPCEAFTVMTIGRNWHPPPTHRPKTDKARLGLELVQAFLEVVKWANEARAAVGLPPVWWWMENPRAKLRALPIMKGHRRITVTYCQYGAKWQKPTDLWGRWPPSWKPKPKCRPKEPCHESAPRGSRKGIQGVGYGTVKDPRGGEWTVRHPQIIGGRRTEEGDILDDSLRGNQSAVRAEVPLALSTELAIACEEQTPRRDGLAAFGMTA